jgi:sugar-specific transcriptional regulator TrmB
MKDALIHYGLSDKEADAYLACLKIGKATANRIAELLDLPRSTTYDILERLKLLGLVTSIIIDNKTNYIASNPEVLLISLEEKTHVIREVLPQFKKIQYKIGDRPAAEVYQGKIAIIKLLDEILDQAKSIKVIGSQGNALEKIGYHPEKFRIKRLEKKIRIKQILEDSPEARKISPDKYTELRYSKSLSESKEAIFMFEDYVYHIIFQYEISAIKIKSKDHADTMGILFDDLWKKSSSK